MNSEIAYSANKVDLFSPGKNAVFFAGGGPDSDAALCAELALLVYCRRDASLALDRERILSVLQSVNFTSCDFFESNSTHAFFTRGPGNVAVLAFRGTDADDPTDLGDDADFRLIPWKAGGRVHRGFARALEEIVLAVENVLRGFDGRLLVTGHSLGAALATLLAGSQKADGLYTFGSPMVGDAGFVGGLSAVRSCRYVDCCDIVTRVPPKLFGYTHVGAPYYIDVDRRITYDPAAQFVASDQSRAREKYLVDYAWRRGTNALRDLSDHAPVNYVAPIVAASSGSRPTTP
jgi:hypothetical protein